MRLFIVPAVTGFLLSVMLAACGGGGGGGGGVANPPAAKAWGTAQLIETDNAGNAFDPQIAFDANGNAIAVWAQYDGVLNNIWTNRYSAASGAWGTAQLIETGSGNSAFAKIAMDASGNAIAVWSQHDGTRYSIWANHYSAMTGTWSTAQLIEAANGDAFSTGIAMHPSGNAIAVWTHHDGTRYNVWANRFNAASGTWGTAQLIETDNGNTSDLQIAIDASGNAIAVWSQHDGTRDNIWANRYSATSGTWGTAQLIETGNGDAFNAEIALDNGGNAIAVWRQFDGTRYNIWANGYSAASSTWGTAQLIETGDGTAESPRISMDTAGNAIAVWSQHDGTRYNIWATRYSVTSGAWGTAQLIETDNAGDASRPQIAFDANGNAIAVWDQHDGTRRNIWANRYTPGGGWGTAQLIETNNTGSAFGPQIAMNASGNAIAVWFQYDGALDNIWANRFQ